MQIYRRLEVGTAKPTAEERARAPIHLIDFVEPDEPYSVAQYQRDARAAIAAISARGKLPILCGGTGLYIRAVLQGFSFPTAEDPRQQEVRQRLQAEAERDGLPALHERLRAVDPEAAERINVADAKRIVRALEVFELTGEPMSRQQTAMLPGCRAGARTPPNAAPNGGAVQARALQTSVPVQPPAFVDAPEGLGYNAATFVLTSPRPALYRRIEARVDAMIAAGWLEEVRALREAGYDPGLQSLQAIGYRQIVQHLAGERDWDETVRLIKQETRRFAKRQETWFRRDSEAVWLSWEDETQFATAYDVVSAAGRLRTAAGRL